VADVPGPGKRNEIALLKAIPSQCTSKNPCTQKPLDTLNLAEAPVDPVSISFRSIANSGPAVATLTNSDGTRSQIKTLDTLEALDRQLSLLTDAYYRTPKEPVIAGSMPDCPSDVRCVNKSNTALSQKYGLYANHEYYLTKYVHDPDLTKATVSLGNPWGFNDPAPLPLPVFRYYFVHLAANYVKPIQPPNCSCGQPIANSSPRPTKLAAR
jgi:hypothetical protein